MAAAPATARVIGVNTSLVPGTRQPGRPRARTRVDAAELDRLSGGRDRVIDLLRIASLVVVIAGHSIMLTVAAGPNGLVLGNVLGDVPALQPVTWMLQIMPLFFFAGAAAATYGWHHDNTPGQWLLSRAQRLLRPVGWYLLAVLATLAVASGIGAHIVVDVVAALGVQLLWFLGAHLLVLAGLPLLQRLSTGRQVAAALAGCWAITALVDAARLTGNLDGVGYLNFVTVWTLPAVLGVAYAKRLVAPRVAAGVALTMLAVDVTLVAAGPYDVSLVTVPGQQLSNMNPPSLLLAGHAIMLCALAIAFGGALTRLAARPRLWWWVILGNRGAMTLYLWHLPVLGMIIGLGLVAGVERDTASAMFPLVVGVQTATLLALMVPVTAVLASLENRRLPWWDTPLARSATRIRDAAILGCLALAAVSILLLSAGGVVDGARWLVVGVAAVLLARHLAVGGPARPATPDDTTAAGA